MSNPAAEKKIQAVMAHHIEPGIAKYGGVVDTALQRHLQRSDCNFIPYKFTDGRYLLVQPEINCAFLYPDVETVYEKLVLD